jgi:hypothetical protein
VTPRDDDADVREARAEAMEERRKQRASTQCRCGEMPGRCPGPAFCPLCEPEEEEETDE